MRKQLLIILGVVLAGCADKPVLPEIKPPTKVELASPAQNEVCTTGAVVSDKESNVTFEWKASENTNSYELNLKNLLTSATVTQSATEPKTVMKLLRNTPYSWFIVSKSRSTTETANSDTWKFYNSGPGVVTYLPYPAEIVAPTFGQTVTAATIDLKWNGAIPPPGVIANYDVYFGTTATPPMIKEKTTDKFVNSVAITAGQTYNWRVVTRDAAGNTSDSGLFQFNVN